MTGACAAVLVYAVAGAAALGLVQRAREGARVRRDVVTGRAATAVGDSGVFASPVLPAGVHTVLAHADAESAAVAVGYMKAPSYQIVTVPYYKVRPTERRHFCGRSYYVRSVAEPPPASVSDSSVTNDPVTIWAPAWVLPVCDDAEMVRTSVLLADVPTRLRVVQGDQPGDVPELVHPPDSYGRIVGLDAKYFPDWERGVGMTPETAVALAAAKLAGTGARVSEVPEAFTIVMAFPPPVRSSLSNSAPQTPTCSRWRLALDRTVTLRGMATGQLVRTRTVYVMRGKHGCDGTPTLQIPLPSQPTTLPFWYGVRPGWPRNWVLPPVNGRPQRPPDPEMRTTALRVTEPVWFEEARPSR